MNIRLITDVKVDYNILNWLIDWLGTYLHTNTLPIFLTTLKEGQRIMTQRGVKESHLKKTYFTLILFLSILPLQKEVKGL